ncbi:MAG: hypothetical protein ACI4A3_09600 [Lachnospiraceae bacterium]
MNRKKEKWFTVITLVLCILLFGKRLTGDIWHAVLGMVFMILIAVHVGRHIVKMKYNKRFIRLVDWILMASTVILLLTGILLHPMQGVLLIKILHKISAVLFVLGIILHMVQHRE